MKKFISIVLSSAIMLTLAACSSPSASPSASPSGAIASASAADTSASATTDASTSASPSASASGLGADGNKIKIGIIQLVEHPALDAAHDGFMAALKDAGYEDGKNITVDFENGQGDQANLKSISQSFVQNKDDLILAIATNAAQSVANETTTTPILITAVTDPVAAKLVTSLDKPGTNVTGTSDGTPMEPQVQLLLKLAPNTKTIGIMYNSSEINSQIQAKQFEDVCTKLGLSFKEGTVASTNDIQQVTQSMVGKVDAIYIPTDNTFASAMDTVSRITTANKIPTIVGDTGMVTCGALGALGVDYTKLGYQTGQMAVKIMKGEATPADMPIETQTDLNCTINQTTADAIGITIPDDLKSTATFIK